MARGDDAQAHAAIGRARDRANVVTRGIPLARRTSAGR